MKVLIAEDNRISCRALAGNLESWGYDVLVTRDGQAAWEAFIEHLPETGAHDQPIQVALLDWEMPRISGLDLCRKIRVRSDPRENHYLYIILMTGRDHQEDILQGLSAGADDYMIKPFDHIELKIRVQNGIRIASLEKSQQPLDTPDGSTLLWPRKQILEFLEDEIQRNNRQNQPTGVVLLGMDGLLQEVGGNSDYPSEERFLVETAQRLKRSMRRYDKIGRLDKEELLAVFPNCRQEHLHIIAERLRRAAVEAFRRHGNSESLRVYLGGASTEKARVFTGGDLLNAAYQALRASRQQDNGRVFFNPWERLS
jgi:diguanylate cyclase (GGDEF)-like protein